MLDKTWLPYPFNLLLRHLRHRNGDGDRWNLCHFFNNFEIAELSFFRSEAYRDLFTYLDHDGGFYYERVCPLSFHPSILPS